MAGAGGKATGLPGRVLRDVGSRAGAWEFYFFIISSSGLFFFFVCFSKTNLFLEIAFDFGFCSSVGFLPWGSAGCGCPDPPGDPSLFLAAPGSGAFFPGDAEWEHSGTRFQGWCEQFLTARKEKACACKRQVSPRSLFSETSLFGETRVLNTRKLWFFQEGVNFLGFFTFSGKD